MFDRMRTAMSLFAVVQVEGGTLSDTDAALLSSTVRLAEQLGCNWQAVTMEEPDAKALAQAGRYATPSFTIIGGQGSGGEAGQQARPELQGIALGDFFQHQSLPVILLPHNDLGTSLAPLLAVRLDAALVAEARQIRLDGDMLCLEQSALGSTIVDRRGWRGNRPLVITLPLESMSTVELPPARHTTPRCIHRQNEHGRTADGSMATSEILERISADPTTVDLTEAEIIFCAGKGCSRTNFQQLEELCGLLKTSLGATRPVYDLGWCPLERMIGQTGRTVKPRLYISFGVSGSMHHVGGIKDAVRIVAVNSDAKAPIFPNADEGYVGDVNEILPILLEKARKLGSAGGVR